MTAHNVAISASDGTLRLSDHGVASAHNGMTRLGEIGSDTVDVPCVSLAGALQRFGTPVQFMKI